MLTWNRSCLLMASLLVMLISLGGPQIKALELEPKTQSLIVNEAGSAFDQARRITEAEQEEADRLIDQAYRRMKLVCEYGQPDAQDYMRFGNIAWQKDKKAEALSAYLLAQQLNPGQPELQAGIEALSSELNVTRPAAPVFVLWSWMPWWGWAALLLFAWCVACVMLVFIRWKSFFWMKVVAVLMVPLMLVGGVGLESWARTLRTPMVVVMKQDAVVFTDAEAGVNAVQTGDLLRLTSQSADRVQVKDQEGNLFWLKTEGVEIIPGTRLF